MERKKLRFPISVFVLVILISSSAFSQMKLSVGSENLYPNDTLKLNIQNTSQKPGYYYISWEVFDNNKWMVLRVDIWNDEPMSEKWNNIGSKQTVDRIFIIDQIFLGTFKKYKELPSRLDVNYTYSANLDQIDIFQSQKFVVQNRLL